MLKKRIKRTLQSFGYFLYHVTNLPFGCDHKEDIARISPKLNVSVIFDVGANIGTTVLEYRRRFPSAKIYAFEPISETFNKLDLATRDDPNIHCHQIALAAQNGSAVMPIQDNSLQNSLKVNQDSSQVKSKTNSEEVKLMTLDSFLESQDDIDKIDILKIDVEGFECEVLQGAQNTLETRKVLYVFSEVTFRENDREHTQFSEIQLTLKKYNFNFMGLYDVLPYWGRGNAINYCNALFKHWEKIYGDPKWGSKKNSTNELPPSPSQG